MKKTLLSMVVVGSLFAASNGYEAGIGIGYNNVTNSNSLNNYGDLNVRISKEIQKNTLLRLELEQTLNKNNITATKFLVNGEYDFEKYKQIKPYVFAGAGYQAANQGYKDSTVMDLGIGGKYKINEKLKAFAELRALRAFDNNDNHFGGLIGISYKFGENSENSTDTKNNVTKEVKSIVDSDKDGVANYLDKCPNTPAGVKVDAKGCAIDSDKDGVANYLDKCPNTPAGVKVDAKGCAIDSDKDGVANYLDKCPNTPAGVKVDAKGCAIDSDKDGVANYLDKCPNTPAGVKVNNKGCAIEYNFGITFSNNSNVLTPIAIKKINKFAEFLKQNPNAKAVIEGYTDNKGNAKYNQKLSEKRAKAVYDELINLGINKNRLNYIGFGVANPIASNTTKEGRKLNRRVIAEISYK